MNVRGGILASELEIGSEIWLGTWLSQKIDWFVVAKNQYFYPKNSVILMSKFAVELTPWNTKQTRYNSSYTYLYPYNTGYSDWSLTSVIQSQIKTWLNSTAAPGAWFTGNGNGSSTLTVAAPPLQAQPGFLWEWGVAERDRLQTPTFYFSKVTGTTGTATSTAAFTDALAATASNKVFLASHLEVGLGVPTGGAYSGAIFEYFDRYLPANEGRIAFNRNGVAVPYWTRDGVGNAAGWTSQQLHIVNATGASAVLTASGTTAYARPCICLSGDTVFNKIIGLDGKYEFAEGTPPIIRGYRESYDLGELRKEFPVQVYSVFDNDKDTGSEVEIREGIEGRFTIKKDKVTVYPEKEVADVTYELKVDQKDWTKIPNGANSAYVEVDDGSNTSYLLFEFVKNEDKILFWTEPCFEADIMPKKCRIAIDGIIPAISKLKIEVCNNGFDENPAWEDITKSVIFKRVYWLLNTEKVADRWGFGIRVSLDRGNAEGLCFIERVSGNFE